MLKYHIKITDNETGEVIDDTDFLCMFGAIGIKNGVRQCALSHAANNFQTAATLIGANDVIEMVVNECGEKMRELIKAMLEERKSNDE